jgi:hypothetical protein
MQPSSPRGKAMATVTIRPTASHGARLATTTTLPAAADRNTLPDAVTA